MVNSTIARNHRGGMEAVTPGVERSTLLDCSGDDLLPTEHEARAAGHRYGLYAQMPGREPVFLSPVWTYDVVHIKNFRESASRDAREILMEFGEDQPGLEITMRDLATGQTRMCWRLRKRAYDPSRN